MDRCTFASEKAELQEWNTEVEERKKKEKKPIYLNAQCLCVSNTISVYFR